MRLFSHILFMLIASESEEFFCETEKKRYNTLLNNEICVKNGRIPLLFFIPK
jgi:hypothetical protein